MALRIICMRSMPRSGGRHVVTAALTAVALTACAAARAESACADGAAVPVRGAAAIDARTLRLTDGSEVRLAGVEAPWPAQDARAIAARQALDALTSGRDLTLHATSGLDRYGRQPAVVFAAGSEASLQAELLGRGLLVAAGSLVSLDCANSLIQRENVARAAGRGVWGESDAIKSAEMPGDILAQVGRFAVIQGRVSSVRESGAIIYVNFGRRWTRDFAVIVSKRLAAGFEAAGLSLKSLGNRTVRVRGVVEQRGGPRIEAFGPWQIEVVGGR